MLHFPDSDLDTYDANDLQQSAQDAIADGSVPADLVDDYLACVESLMSQFE